MRKNTDINQVINEAHRDMQFGTMVFYVKKHQGEVATLDTQKIFINKTNDNTEAVQIIVQLIKGIKESAKDKDSLSLTIEFVNGDARTVSVQDMQRINFLN